MYDYTFEISVETLENYRKMGIAKELVKKILIYCNENHYKVYWDCMIENVSSIALAESLGLEKVLKYTLYGFKL